MVLEISSEQFDTLKGIQEHTIFISCITPSGEGRTLYEVAKMWGISNSNLYGEPINNLLKAGLVKEVNKTQPVRGETRYETDYDKFIEWLSSIDPRLFGTWADRLKKIFKTTTTIDLEDAFEEGYFFGKNAGDEQKIIDSKLKKGEIKRKLVFDFIPKIFYKEPKIAKKYFYIFPRILFLIPVGIWRLKGEPYGLTTLTLMSRSIYPDLHAGELTAAWFSILTECFQKDVKAASEEQIDHLIKYNKETWEQGQSEYSSMFKQLNSMRVKKFRSEQKETFVKRMGQRKKQIGFK